MWLISQITSSPEIPASGRSPFASAAHCGTWNRRSWKIRGEWPHPPQTGFMQALDGANPEFVIGIYRIFHQHGYVGAFQGIGNFLHGKGVHRGARADPEHVDAEFQAFIHVLGIGHFVVVFMPGFDPSPGATRLAPGYADPLKCSGPGTGFPDARAKQIDTLVLQTPGSSQHLFFGFGRAGAGDEDRTFKIEYRLESHVIECGQCDGMWSLIVINRH
jgi:hypothetical protein